jgi:hypothetical protein
MLVMKDSNRFVKTKQYNWMLVSGDRHDIFSLESICLTDSSVGSRSSIQIRGGYYRIQTAPVATRAEEKRRFENRVVSSNKLPFKATGYYCKVGKLPGE